jgi:hypothetical protein
MAEILSKMTAVYVGESDDRAAESFFNTPGVEVLKGK